MPFYNLLRIYSLANDSFTLIDINSFFSDFQIDPGTSISLQVTWSDCSIQFTFIAHLNHRYWTCQMNFSIWHQRKTKLLSRCQVKCPDPGTQEVKGYNTGHLGAWKDTKLKTHCHEVGRYSWEQRKQSAAAAWCSLQIFPWLSLCSVKHKTANFFCIQCIFYYTLQT